MGGGLPLNKLNKMFFSCFSTPYVVDIYHLFNAQPPFSGRLFLQILSWRSMVGVVLPSENKNVKRYNVNALSKIKNVTT